MCWIGLTINKKIATKDIKCKKIIVYVKNGRYSCYAPYYFTTDMIYEIGKGYSRNICAKPLNDFSTYTRITNGLHSYSEECTAILRMDGGIIIKTKTTEKVVFTKVHSECSSSGYMEPVLVECTIPKGSTYYENKYGEIVSDRLKINKVLIHNTK